MHFPVGSVVNNLPANAGGPGSMPRWGRSPGEGNGNLLQYSCLGNPMDRGARQAIVRGVAKESDTTEQLNSNNNKGYSCCLLSDEVHSCYRPSQRCHLQKQQFRHLLKQLQQSCRARNRAPSLFPCHLWGRGGVHFIIIKLQLNKFKLYLKLCWLAALLAYFSRMTRFEPMTCLKKDENH